MNTIDSQILITGLLFVFTVGFGVWLSRAGKPYNSLLFNVHKLVALGAVISAAVTLYPLRTGVDVTALALGAIVLTGLLILGLFISGALLRIGKPDHVAILMVHRVAPLLVTVSAATAIYLLAKQLAVM
jgi:hypothetical protein